MPMKRLLPIAASLALIIAASATAQDAAAPATASPVQDAASAAPVAAESAPAAAPAPVAIAGDAARGKGLTYTCRGCHGLTGYKNAYPSYKVPKIGGQSAQYLTQALTEYREGKRKHPTMQAQSMSFSTQEIADLAAYLSTLK